MRTFRGCMVALLMLVSVSFAGQSQAAAQQPSAVQQIASVTGLPVAAGQYLFWLEQPAASKASQGHGFVYGYDLTTSQTFRLTEQLAERANLVSDGRYVLWVEANATLHGFDLVTRQPLRVATIGVIGALSDMALADGVLYYADPEPRHLGIFAHELATGKEQQLHSRPGHKLVAADGLLLWSESKYAGKASLPEVALYLLKLDAKQAPQVLAQDRAELSGYSVAGDQIVWSFYPPARTMQAQLYSVSTCVQQTISSAAALYPTLSRTHAVWTTLPTNPVDQPTRWAIQSYRLADKRLSSLVGASGLPVRPLALLAQTSVPLLLDSGSGSRSLQIADLRQENLAFAAPLLNDDTRTGGTRADLAGGQIRICASNPNFLCDAAGLRWKVNGVQFILPQRQINFSTFWDVQYQESIWDGSLEYWLGIAQQNLLSKTLRVFVEMPRTDGSTPTSVANLVDFTRRANARGLRVGLVLHNVYGDWQMTTARRNWINSVIDTLVSQGALHRLAYVSAGNELNNCGGTDCFVNQTELNNAVNWVAAFHSTIKARNTSLLTTVGMGTEAGGSDLYTQVRNYFKPDSSGRRMANIVDFISPHNYGGGAYAIIDEVRRNGYNRPIVLEEYGFPTDDVYDNPLWTEGPAGCRADPGFPPSSPNHSACRNTAPYFVEINARAMRDTAFAGGSAWMLADLNYKSCSSSPFDFWTGLYAAGTGYCGGTFSTSPVAEKSTAFRVKTHHYYY